MCTRKRYELLPKRYLQQYLMPFDVLHFKGNLVISCLLEIQMHAKLTLDLMR